MKNAIKFCIIGLIFTPAFLFAQPKVAPSWSAKFSGAIKWQKVHSLGYIIVCTGDGLYGVNPADGTTSWENRNFAALDPSMMEEIEGTEFLAITYKIDPNSSVPLQAIIKVMDGKVLFDSQKEGIGVLSRHVLPKSSRLLIMGVKQGAELKDLYATVFMYDILSGKQLWVNDKIFKPEPPKTGGFLGQLQAMGNQLGGLQKLTSEPVEINDQFVIITHPFFAVKLNSSTGDQVWKNALAPSKKAKVLFSPFVKDVTYVAVETESSSGSGFTTTSGNQQGQPNKFYENQYFAFDSNTGSPLWKQPAKEQDHLNQIIMLEKGMIICPMSSQKPTINFVDYATGATIWGKKGKGIKTQGSVVSYIQTEKGILITTAFDNAWNNQAEEYYLNVLDPSTATFKYEKSVKLKGDLVATELVPKGLLFVTKREINILDVNTGTLVWPNSIEAGSSLTGDKVRPFPVGTREGKLYVFSPKDAAIYEIDKQAGTNRVVSTSKIQFEGKELPSAVEVVGDGVVLSSDQNIMKVDFKGSAVYSKYYPAPREPALLRALYAAQAVRAAYYGAAYTAYGAEFAKASQQTTNATGKEIDQQLSKGFTQAGDAAFNYSSQAMKQFSARYKASRSTPDFVIMMTKQEKKGNQLIQVSKNNGDILRSVDIKNDKDPEYDVDQIFNQVYYRPTDREIVCYKL